MTKQTNNKKKTMWISLAIAALIILMVAFVSKYPWKKMTYHKTNALDSAVVTIPDETVAYTGDYVEPELQVALGKKILKEGEDYEVQYYQNMFPGTAFARVYGVGDYDGDCFIKFRILIDDPVCDDPANERLVKMVFSWYEIMFDNARATRDQVLFFVNKIKEKDLDEYDIIHVMFTDVSDDFWAYPLEDLVQRTYKAFYLKDADTSSIDYWVGMMEREEITRTKFLTCILESEEFKKIVFGNLEE